MVFLTILSAYSIIQESDRKNSLREDLNEILSEEKLKEGQTDPLKTSADHRMIAIVDEKMKKITSKYTKKHIVGSPYLV